MTFREEIRDILAEAVRSSGYELGERPLVLEKPRTKEHGDICTPVALALAKPYKKSPIKIAEEIAGKAAVPSRLATVEVAKPGYINLRLSHGVLLDGLTQIVTEKDRYGTADYGGGTKCQVEYVSANPTGPLVVVSARAAAVGSVIVNLLRHIGYDVEAEYYVNDYGNQVQALGESLRFRVREKHGLLEKGEELGAYPGQYVADLAAQVGRGEAEAWEAEGGATGYGRFATDAFLESIEKDLELFGVRFDSFFCESTLHPDAVEQARAFIDDKGFSYEEDGALYFKSTAFGDEKDRVLVKSDGTPTYFLGDIAYHRTKIERGYKRVIDLLGPDHQGHIPRLEAAAQVLGAGPDWLEAIVVGWVRLLEGNKQVSMSKRAGEFITLRDLIDDVGTDVTKFFFLMRRANSPLDFDLDLARKQSDENPVYYVQYAHARIASVIRFATEKQVEISEDPPSAEQLRSPAERDLMVHLMYYPYVVEGAALTREPHRLTVYARELATFFHQFYHDHRIVTDEPDLSAARMRLAVATKQVLQNALHLVGVSAPSSM